MKFKFRALAFLAAAALLLGAGTAAFADGKSEADKARAEAAAFVLDTVKNPAVGTTGGEWAVLGLARSGYEVPRSYFENYYTAVQSYVKEREGVLDQRKYTEYSRVILGLTAAGFDPRDVGGYDLTLPLGDFENTVWQGINGPVFALIALDSAGYEIPHNPAAGTPATRGMYIEEILGRQLQSGGFALSALATAADPDITGMTLQALSKYQNRQEVGAAIDRALICLSEMQNPDGGYLTGGYPNSESVAQVIVALCELKIGIDDPRFVKNGNTLLDSLLDYRVAGGAFEHIKGDGGNLMATEQALYALAALHRFENGLNSLYDMTDTGINAPPEEGGGLPGKHEDVSPMPVTFPGKSFSDISGHRNQDSIENLAARAIIDGLGDGSFGPDRNMTRAQYAAIVTRGLGLSPRANGAFSDVPAGSWYEGYIGAANSYGIVNGKTAERFDPEGQITVQEAAAMTARAARLCGLDTAMSDAAIQIVLAQFPDYLTVADYAREPLAFCYGEGLLSQEDLYIEPGRYITRCEIAEMLCRMLERANLLKPGE